uniref:Uncharacterized protein n=1 Tax=Oryza punctata TaxID=4537 RepID=A0A0E0MBZ5_ORYPU
MQLSHKKMAPALKENNGTIGKKARDGSMKKSFEANVLKSAKRKYAGASVGKSKATSTSHNSTKEKDHALQRAKEFKT